MQLSAIRRATTRAAALLTTLLTATAGLSVAAAPAQAANRVTPGGFSGYGFDQCETQSQEVMDTWLTSSPYWAVGVYIAGTNRHCGGARQGNLTATWIATQLRNGWRLLPITLGPQAWCTARERYLKQVRINPDPAKANSVELIIRQGHGVNRVSRVITNLSEMTLWGTKFEAFIKEVGLECRRGLGKR